jgi:hypothetical protein
MIAERSTAVVLRVPIPGLVVLRPMILTILMVAMLAMAIPVALRPKAAEETTLPEMAESLGEATGGLENYSHAWRHRLTVSWRSHVGSNYPLSFLPALRLQPYLLFSVPYLISKSYPSCLKYLTGCAHNVLNLLLCLYCF